MATIHFILQGKGGIGKSFVATMIAMYLQSKEAKYIAYDTDPVNSTLFGFKGLNVKRVDIMNEEDVDPRKFDVLVQNLLTAAENEQIIIDTGSNSFINFCSYLLSNDIFSLLTEYKHRLVIHTVIAGGQPFKDTIIGFAALAEQFPINTEFALWLNPLFGEISNDGKTFEQLNTYAKHKDKIIALIYLPQLKKNLHQLDFQKMLENRKTFDEAINDKNTEILIKHRLKIVKETIFSLINSAGILNS